MGKCSFVACDECNDQRQVRVSIDSLKESYDEEEEALLSAKAAMARKEREKLKQESWGKICMGCTACCCCCHVTILAVLIWLLAVASVTVHGTTFNYFNYYRDMGSYFLAGRADDVSLFDWYKRLPEVSEGIVAGPGPNTQSFYGWQQTHDELNSWGDRIKKGTLKRYNQLGITIQNDAVWPEIETIALGLPNGVRHRHRHDHAFVRPFLGNAVDKAHDASSDCDGTTCWNMRWLRKVFKERLASMDFLGSSDLKWIMTVVLHKVLLNIDISDEEAQEFASWMTAFLLPQPLPKAWVDNFIVSWLLAVPEVLDTKTSLMNKYKEAIKKKWPDIDWQSKSEDLVTLASTMVDALALAGGLSVPGVLDFMIALLFMQTSPADASLRDFRHGGAKLHEFMLETMRRYAPVAGVPSWTTDDGGATWQHKIPNLQMAMMDPSVFPEPLEFRPGRPGLTEEDDSRSLFWAEAAEVDDDVAHPDSHSCPGKQLSVQMISAFIQELALAGRWEVQTHTISLTLYGPSGWLLKKTGTHTHRPDHPLPDEPLCQVAPRFCRFVNEADLA